MAIEVDVEGDDLEMPEGPAEGAAEAMLAVASLATSPVCLAHQNWRRISTVRPLNPNATELSIRLRQFYHIVLMVAFASLAVPLAAVGITLRKIAISLKKQPFYYKRYPVNEVLPNPQITLYTHNFGTAPAGYAISDAGVTPWQDRMPAIAKQILNIDADVHVSIEIMRTQTAKAIEESLKEKYAHVFHSFGKRAIGPCAGLLIASKVPIEKVLFTPFPEEYLVGRAKSSTKGFVQIFLKNGMHIIATHMLHSEECGYPTPEEVEAREKQMEMIEAAFKASKARLRVLTGDLNMDEKEWEKYSGNYQRDETVIGKDTWGGDKWYATMVGGKKISGPLVYDYTAIYGQSGTIKTELIETGYDDNTFKADALSDHKGMFSTISF